MKRTNDIIAVLFLLCLAGMAALACLGFPVFRSQLAEGWNSREAEADTSLLAKADFVMDQAESAFNQALDQSHLFIQLYGGVQRLAGRRMVADVSADTTVTKLADGSLTFCGLDNQYAAPTEQAQATAQFSAELDRLGIPFLAAVAPQKIPTQGQVLPSGVKEYGNETADAYLELVEAEGVDTLDLRPVFAAQEDWGSYFFRTDHHWRPEGAFLAYQTLAAALDARCGSATDPAFTDPDSYALTVYEDLFLGSQGKRVGSLYAGADDFTVYTPGFPTSFTYTTPYEVREGSFNEALCFAGQIARRDWFSGNPYTYYSGGDYGYASIVNHQNPDGPRVVLLRDSFACAITPFLALSCGELITVDLRYYEGDLPAELEALQPDLVVLMYAASSFRLPSLFQFD